MRFLQLIFLILSSTLILAEPTFKLGPELFGINKQTNSPDQQQKERRERIQNEHKFMPFMCRSQAASRSKQQIRWKLTRGLFEGCEMAIQHKLDEIGKKFNFVESYLGTEDYGVKHLKELAGDLNLIEKEINASQFGHYNVEQIKGLRDENFFWKLHDYEQNVRNEYKKVQQRLAEFKHKANEVISEVRMGNPAAIKETKNDLTKMRDEIIDENGASGRLLKDEEKLENMWEYLVKDELERIDGVLLAIDKVPDVKKPYSIKVIKDFIDRMEESPKKDIGGMKKEHKKLNELDNGLLKDAMAYIWFLRLNKLIVDKGNEIKEINNKKEESEIKYAALSLSERRLKFEIGQLRDILRNLSSCSRPGKCKISRSPSQGMRYFGENGACIYIYKLGDKKRPDCIH